MPHAVPGIQGIQTTLTRGFSHDGIDNNLGPGGYNLIRGNSYLCRAPSPEYYYPPEHPKLKNSLPTFYFVRI